MKNFVTAPIGEQAKQQSIVFIICNIYQIVTGFLDISGGPIDEIVNLTWGVSLSVIILGNWELTKDRVPSYFKTSGGVLASIILVATFIERLPIHLLMMSLRLIQQDFISFSFLT